MKNPNDEIWLLLDSRDFGGIESHVLQLAKGLKTFQRSVRVIFLCRYSTTHPLIALLNEANISYRFLEGSFSSLLTYTRHHNPKVIHSHGYKAALYSRLLRISQCSSHQKIRFINTYHAGEISQGKLAIYDFVDRWSAPFSHYNFAVSELIKKRIPSKTTVLNNFVNTQNLTQSEGTQIAFVGRLSHEKAPDRFLELANQLSKVQFHFYGSGPMEKDLQNNSPSNLHFHGHQNSMDAIWPHIGLLVICSRYEGLPMVALEAMGRGIPVISTPVGNMSTLICNNENGWVVNPDALPTAIKKWVNLPLIQVQTIQKNAQQTVQHTFSSQAVIPSLLSAYQI
ncbi:glycosyltransferase family 4 protein [Aliivibrio fischeri]|uniref:glycosyltransferase family 4 protein n=1 Tax=Aliivibrio fischeri TaxID=668 RepID=UPI0009080F1C|nr:glycosyltransferase family 4 protein [Aliivibrio fischeri]